MKKNILVASFFFIALLPSCTKKVDCDNAELCIKNIGTDTIRFCWGCNLEDQILAPGKNVCKNVGEIHISSTTEDIQWVDFNSDHGSYRIKVDDCHVEKDIK